MKIGRLHVLTDFLFQQRRSHADLAEAALAGGADTVQFRQKEGALRDKLVEAERTAAVCRRHGAPLLIDDHLDLMLAVGADGVHLGQEDLPVAVARRVLGSDAVIGATVTTVAQAREAEAAGASYLGFGPVYTTHSKRNPAAVKGLDGLAAVCRAVALPVVGIAGITPERVRPVLEAGAHGVAVMTAITTADEPAAAAAAFRAAISAVA
ncbi:MAG: thiamine phosphate synthase [Rhodothermales bacterium]|nr:thiamine phosphate synthase [Rhodothermales bacterium]